MNTTTINNYCYDKIEKLTMFCYIQFAFYIKNGKTKNGKLWIDHGLHKLNTYRH